MSKILQKASKTAEAKRAQSGAHQAATSEVERCLSGEVRIYSESEVQSGIHVEHVNLLSSLKHL
jgi:hypothetical protein